MSLKLTLYSVVVVLLAFAGLFALSPANPVGYMTTGDPLVIVGVIAAAVVVASFVFGWTTSEYSWVDRIWSIAPVIYTWFFAVRAWPDPRLILIAVLVTLWGARLTYNFARKGGYSGVEDYRWAVMRKAIPNKFFWQLFNLGFISFYQNLLILLFTLPAYIAYLYKGKPLGNLDLIAGILFLAFLTFETVADQQQWNFHQLKKKKKTGKKFLTTGLFRFSRHPNYFAEVSIWWVIYFFGVAASVQWLNWSVIGAVLLTVLFQGSSVMTENISKGKYPGYTGYQKKTSKIFPWFPRG
jgi:steroid 5-alpha reductase family enzyme